MPVHRELILQKDNIHNSHSVKAILFKIILPWALMKKELNFLKT
jgi:hypothetical protein